MDTVTKIKDLIAALQECDPNGTITLSLNSALLYGGDEPGEIEYGFEPKVDYLLSKPDAERSDRVYFHLPQKVTEQIVASRRRADDANSKASSTNPGVITNAPVAVAIALTQDTYANLLVVVENCNRADEDSKGATTHGRLDVPRLLAMLAEDAAMTNTRPGSWEGANLQQVLDSHGYH